MYRAPKGRIPLTKSLAEKAQAAPSISKFADELSAYELAVYLQKAGLTLDNLVDKWPIAGNARLFQPEAKIAAEPGKSGSSEVFRTDTGQKPPGPQSPQTQWRGHADNPWETASPNSDAKPTDAVPTPANLLIPSKRRYAGQVKTTGVAGSR